MYAGIEDDRRLVKDLQQGLAHVRRFEGKDESSIAVRREVTATISRGLELMRGVLERAGEVIQRRDAAKASLKEAEAGAVSAYRALWRGCLAHCALKAAKKSPDAASFKLEVDILFKTTLEGFERLDGLQKAALIAKALQFTESILGEGDARIRGARTTHNKFQEAVEVLGEGPSGLPAAMEKDREAARVFYVASHHLLRALVVLTGRRGFDVDRVLPL